MGKLGLGRVVCKESNPLSEARGQRQTRDWWVLLNQLLQQQLQLCDEHRVCVFKHPAVFVASASPASLFGVFVASFPLVADTSIDSIHRLTHVDVDAHSSR